MRAKLYWVNIVASNTHLWLAIIHRPARQSRGCRIATLPADVHGALFRCGLYSPCCPPGFPTAGSFIPGLYLPISRQPCIAPVLPELGYFGCERNGSGGGAASNSVSAPESEIIRLGEVTSHKHTLARAAARRRKKIYRHVEIDIDRCARLRRIFAQRSSFYLAKFTYNIRRNATFVIFTLLFTFEFYAERSFAKIYRDTTSIYTDKRSWFITISSITEEFVRELTTIIFHCLFIIEAEDGRELG